MSATGAVLLLVGVPLLVIGLVSLAVLGPEWGRAGRWRPGQPWLEKPMWFGGLGEAVPPGVETAAAAALALEAGPREAAAQVVADGGVPVPAEGIPVAELATEAEFDQSDDLGGARGQW